MTIDQRKRQKKLERQKAKQKAERRESQGLPLRLEQTAAAPILHCCTTAAIWREGIGHVLVSRQLANGDVAFVLFLVDMYCLGVKDVIIQIAPRARYERDLYEKLARQDKLLPLKPECARKLVEGAVQYALDLGLPPYPDYRTAKLIFGDISAEACTEEYEFGQDGKPFFVAGPYDSASRCQQIIRALDDHCEPGGYHFFCRPDPTFESDGRTRHKSAFPAVTRVRRPIRVA